MKLAMSERYIPQLPTEILSEIVQHALNSVRSAPPFATCDYGWSCINGMTLANRRFRHISLHAWFRILVTLRKGDWKKIKSIQNGLVFTWVRYLRCKRASLGVSSLHVLPRFTQLSRVWIHVQEYVCSSEDEPLCFRKMLGALPSTVTCLELVALHDVDAELLGIIVERLPGLIQLHLDPANSSCGCGRTEDMPIGTKFVNGKEFADFFVDHLASMNKLEHLQLDMWLTPAQARVNHENTYIIQHCKNCSSRYQESTLQDEVLAAETIARGIPSLKVFSLLTCFPAGGPFSARFEIDRNGEMISCRRCRLVEAEEIPGEGVKEMDELEAQISQ